MTTRRAFLGTLASSLLAAPLVAEAQEPSKVYRIGFLNSSGPEQDSFLWDPLREALRERGWVEGKNLIFERRYTEGNYERLPDAVADLIRLKVDVLVPHGGPASTAAKRATATIPIVIWGTTDPVGIGVVSNLGRPGGNITGLAEDPGAEMIGKRLQLLKEVAPRVSKVAVLTRVPPSVAVPRIASYENAYEALANALGLQQRWWYLQNAEEINKAFTAIVREGFNGLDVSYVPVTWTHLQQIRELAARHRLPAVYWHRRYALDGGLMAYGEDEREVPRRLAVYLDKILKGAKPGDLPVEQPTKFELVINLKTAKALGLTIPPSLLARADEVIE